MLFFNIVLNYVIQNHGGWGWGWGSGLFDFELAGLFLVYVTQVFMRFHDGHVYEHLQVVLSRSKASFLDELLKFLKKLIALLIKFQELANLHPLILFRRQILSPLA
jgi:hypothetical protein